jgi:hypothetical protein
MHEEGPDLRGILSGVQFARVAVGARIAAKERPTLAPASASDQLAGALDYKVRTVANQLGVDAKRAAQCAFDLGGAVLACGAGRRAMSASVRPDR